MSTEDKKPYAAPGITLVDLRPEEAVLGACKTVSIIGPGGPDCNFLLGGCSTTGS